MEFPTFAAFLILTKFPLFIALLRKIQNDISQVNKNGSEIVHTDEKLHDDMGRSQEDSSVVNKALLKLTPHEINVITQQEKIMPVSQYSELVNQFVTALSNMPITAVPLNDPYRLSLEGGLRDMISSIPKIPPTSPKRYPDNFLSRVLIDNFDLIYEFSLTYMNLSLTSHLTKFLVNVIYALQFWEVYHLVYLLSPNFKSFLSLLDFSVHDTPFGDLIKPPKNLLIHSMYQGFQYPFPYPFYNYSYHHLGDNLFQKYSKVNITPYIDITLKNIQIAAPVSIEPEEEEVVPVKRKRGRPVSSKLKKPKQLPKPKKSERLRAKEEKRETELSQAQQEEMPPSSPTSMKMDTSMTSQLIPTGRELLAPSQGTLNSDQTNNPTDQINQPPRPALSSSGSAQQMPIQYLAQLQAQNPSQLPPYQFQSPFNQHPVSTFPPMQNYLSAQDPLSSYYGRFPQLPQINYQLQLPQQSQGLLNAGQVPYNPGFAFSQPLQYFQKPAIVNQGSPTGQLTSETNKAPVPNAQTSPTVTSPTQTNQSTQSPAQVQAEIQPLHPQSNQLQSAELTVSEQAAESDVVGQSDQVTETESAPSKTAQEESQDPLEPPTGGAAQTAEQTPKEIEPKAEQPEQPEQTIAEQGIPQEIKSEAQQPESEPVPEVQVNNPNVDVTNVEKPPETLPEPEKSYTVMENETESASYFRDDGAQPEGIKLEGSNAIPLESAIYSRPGSDESSDEYSDEASYEKGTRNPDAPLRRHKSRASVIHQCHLPDPQTYNPCNKIFYGKNELLRHQEFVHATRKRIYKCVYCTKTGSKVQSYPRHDSLARHIRRKHGITGKENKLAVNYAKENVEIIEDPNRTTQSELLEIATRPLPHPQFLNPDYTLKSNYTGFLLFNTREKPSGGHRKGKDEGYDGNDGDDDGEDYEREQEIEKRSRQQSKGSFSISEPQNSLHLPPQSYPQSHSQSQSPKLSRAHSHQDENSSIPSRKPSLVSSFNRPPNLPVPSVSRYDYNTFPSQGGYPNSYMNHHMALSPPQNHVSGLAFNSQHQYPQPSHLTGNNLPPPSQLGRRMQSHGYMNLSQQYPQQTPQSPPQAQSQPQSQPQSQQQSPYTQPSETAKPSNYQGPIMSFANEYYDKK